MIGGKLKISLIFIFILWAEIASAGELIDLVNSFNADRRALYTTYQIKESDEFYGRLSHFYKDWGKRVDAVEFSSLSTSAKADYILLKNLIKKEEYQLGINYEAYKKNKNIVDFADDLYAFVAHRRRGKKPNAKELANQFFEAGKHIDKKMQEQAKTPFNDIAQALKSRDIVRSLKNGLKESFEFYYRYDPDFTWWVKEPYEALYAKLEQYEEILRQNINSNAGAHKNNIVGKPVGRKTLEKLLQYEFISLSPEELLAGAEQQFEWIKAEMLKITHELGYGDDWKAALESVKDTYVPPGKQPDTINGLYAYSLKFIEDNDLITIPEMAKETWGMIMMTPERQKINPFFTGGWEISISYPTQEMSQPDKMMSMRGNNPNFSFPTVQHELIPGHNLQFFMNERYKSYRKVFDTPFWMEGWALYWEIILWDKGFPQTADQKMGMLFWRLHRAARIIFSLKYQLGLMSAQEAIDFLVDKVGHEYANAEAEVRRSFTGGTPPLYQIAYLVGGLQFYALKNELIKKGWTEKEYHDRVLKENRMPVEILRLLLMNEDFSKDYTTNWKFSMDFKQ